MVGESPASSASRRRRFHWTDVRYHGRSSNTTIPSPPATMKLSWGFVFSSLYCSVAAAKPGRVYVYDPVAKAPPQPQSVSPETARLILAQRLGLSRFHSIQHANDETIQQLNAYGGRQQKLFGREDRERTRAHVLVWIEDVEDATG